ncbi:hypothetical protein Tco_0733324 [Tanacetum coccineum]
MMSGLEDVRYINEPVGSRLFLHALDLDFEPLSSSLSSMPSCDLVSFDKHLLITMPHLESFKTELEKSLSLNLELS